MTDVWKSNARKFCEICKVWFADNKVSIEHHESGRKHKEAIQAKLREIGKQSKQKEKAQASLQATLAAMESAAKRSMVSDSSGATSSTSLPCGPIGPSPKPRTYIDPRAYSSSVAAMAQEMARRKKEHEEAAKTTKKLEHCGDDDEESTQKHDIKCKQKEEIVWAETSTNDGIPYYFHIYSGDTVWEAPEKFYTAAQYAARIASLESSKSASDGLNVGSQQMYASPASRRAWGLKQEESSSDTKLNRATRRAVLTDTRETNGISSDGGDVAVDVADIPTPDSLVSSATYDYHTAVYADPAAIAAAFRLEDHDIPLPPPPEDSHTETTVEEGTTPKDDPELASQIKEEPKNADEDSTVDGIARMATEPNVKVEAEGIVEKSTICNEVPKSPPSVSRPSPYGEWRKVEKCADEPKIDYELPTEEEGRKATKEATTRSEVVVKFGEKSTPVTRKRPKAGPIEFKKRKINMNARRRGDAA